MSDWGGCIASAKIEGQWMNGPWVQSRISRLTQATVMDCSMDNVPLFWRPGVKVLGNEDYLEKNVYGIGKIGLVRGTAIADKRYPSHLHGNHVAIYLSQTRDSITVIDQWINRDKQGKFKSYQLPNKRILYRGGGISNNCRCLFGNLYAVKDSSQYVYNKRNLWRICHI